jgi:hypothetical protein
MNHALTVGDLLWPAIAIGGIIAIFIIIAIVLSVFADAFKH